MRLFLFFLLFSFIFLDPVLAEENGVTIEPALQKVFIESNNLTREPLQKVSIQNNTNIPQYFSVEAIEFTNIDKYGGNIFLGQSIAEGDFKKASFVNVESSNLELLPGEKKELLLELTNTEVLAPGAHYGAVLLRAVRNDGSGESDPSRVYLRQIAASLLYISKEAGTEKRMSIEKVRYFQRSVFLPDTVTARFINQGSAPLEPRGLVVLKNPFGNEVTRGILNETSKILFPGQERELEAKVKKVNYFLPGRYTITVLYRFDDGDYQSTDILFWYWQPLVIFGFVFLIFLLVFFKKHIFLRLIKSKKK